MSLLSGVTAFFGLDIGTTAVRLVELRGTGTPRTLVKYAYVPIDSRIAVSDSKADQQKLVGAISQLLEQANMQTRDVAVGLPSQRVFTTVSDFDRLPESELSLAIKYQADGLIPTPLAESKIDWAVVGDSPADPAKVEVLLSSVPNSFIEQKLDMLEGIGLNVVSFEPDNLALSRALLPPETIQASPGAQLILDIGNKSTDLVVTMDGAPRLTRSIPTGMEAIIRGAAQNLNIDDKQAEQFVYKFGLGKDKLEGQVYEAIINTIELLASEVEKSIKFFQTRYTNRKVDLIIVTGGASSLPDFPLYLANKFSVNVEIGNTWRNVAFSPERQNELLAISNQFAVAVGLAQRVE